MTTTARLQILLIVLLFLVLPVAGCSGTGGGHKSVHGPFPVPSEIQDNVAFWRNVYSEWSRGQVAIHDDEYMGVIYEVANLPGSRRAGYTAEQKRFVRARKAHYRSRLEDLEDRIRSGLPPGRYQKALYNKLVDAGGKHAVWGAADRVRSQRGLRERFRRGLAISGRYDAKFREIFRAKGLPEDLAFIPHVESSFQAHARSGVGAAGMWQFMRGTGKLYMRVNGTLDERLDPVIAAEGAARYLNAAYRKLGSWPLAVTSYNHGQGGMQKAKAIYGNDIGTIVRRYKGPLFGFASRNFYAEFVAAREIASRPERYFSGGIRYQKPLSEDRLVLRHSMSAPWVARHYGVSTYRLADLNRHWKKSVREGRARLPVGSTVWLPGGMLERVAGAPTPMPIMVAKAESRPRAGQRPVRVAKAVSSSEAKRKPVRVAKAKVEAKARKKPVQVAKAQAKAKAGKKPVQVAKAQVKAKAGKKPVQVAKAQTKAKARKKPVRVAKAQAKAKARKKPVRVAKAQAKAKAGKKPVQVAKAKVKAKARKKPVRVAKAAPKPAKKSKAAKIHVVKPNETLYRVSTYYALSVAELRRLNRMGPEDTHIRPGQQLRVSG
ncbi:MAG: transglycosylase SLT domain-containing protein [Candidatus Thiosymbion ectosymbiont of Robbea hypermnestra]|nr:transglycosylase SLT domain-containing protein [Candidatus Thiosymbion ectosymbiont of Robbea hypermnestra]